MQILIQILMWLINEQATIVGSGSLQSKENINNFCILQDIHTGLVPFKSAQKPAFGDIYFC